MCRLLLVKSNWDFQIKPHLESFAGICRDSKEYQGHGWGTFYLENGSPQIYKHIDPIWSHDYEKFGSTRFLMVHARSAFRDTGITTANNMPFTNQHYAFIFNGELHGVRLKADGRIGAEKLFNFIKRLDKGSMEETFHRAVRLIRKGTAYIRAMNILMADIRTQSVYLCSLFNNEPDYFTLYIKKLTNGFIICSDVYPGEKNWNPIRNDTVEVFS